MRSITHMNVLPLGGYVYVQPGSGMKFDGNTAFKAQVMQIRAHRLGNKLPRVTVEEVTQDLVDYTCNRVPGVCSESGAVVTFSVATGVHSSSPASPGQPRQTSGCGTCGGRKG